MAGKSFLRRLAIETGPAVYGGTTYGLIEGGLLHQGIATGAEMGAIYGGVLLVTYQALRRGTRVASYVKHHRAVRREALSHGPLKFD